MANDHDSPPVSPVSSDGNQTYFSTAHDLRLRRLTIRGIFFSDDCHGPCHRSHHWKKYRLLPKAPPVAFVPRHTSCCIDGCLKTTCVNTMRCRLMMAVFFWCLLFLKVVQWYGGSGNALTMMCFAAMIMAWVPVPFVRMSEWSWKMALCSWMASTTSKRMALWCPHEWHAASC